MPFVPAAARSVGPSIMTDDPFWWQPTGAVEVLPAGAAVTDYDAWCAARNVGIGGSDIATVLGIMGSLYALWLTKTGRRPPIPDTPAMKRGRYLEPAIAQWFADESGLHLAETGTWAVQEKDEHTGTLLPGWMRCNPDRLTSDGGVLEIKAPNPTDWGHLWAHGPALHALVQLLWCLAVLNAPHGYIAADLGAELAWWRVERDLEVEDWLIDTVGAFFFDYVIEDVAPPVDGSDETLAAIKQASKPPTELGERVNLPGCADWARRRRVLKTELTRLGKELKEIENAFKAALIEHRTAYDGTTPVLSWDWAALDSDTTEPYRMLKEPKTAKARKGART
jgi:predicted phage-related endonuclease